MNCPGYPPPKPCPNPRPKDSPKIRPWCPDCELARAEMIVAIIGAFLLGARQNREAAERANEP